MSLRLSRFLKYALSFCIVAAPCRGMAESLLGVYYGNQGWKMDQVRALESWQGKRHAVVNLFTNWSSATKVMDNLFKQQLPNIWNNANVPMITWEPYTGKVTPTDIAARIASGNYNAYINNWADRLKTFLSGPDGIYNSPDDRRVYIRLAHEMNGDWYPWGAAMGNTDPADYVAMWRRVVAIFDNKGLDATHVQWVWCVNSEDIGGFKAEQFYPGDAYVNWVAIDGYNWGTSQTWSSWRSPEEIYDDMLGRIRAFAMKPLALTEFASASAQPWGTSITDKLLWINDLFVYVTANDIRLVSWFNEDKEVDWAVFGGVNGDGIFKYGRTTYKTYSTYRTSVSSPNFVSSAPSNPKLLTDAQFAGE